VPYRAILFDLGRVLVHFDFQRVYRKLEAMCPVPAAEIPKRFAETHLAERLESGQLESREFHAEVSRILQINVDFDAFCTMFCEIFTDTLVPDSLVEELSGRYRLVLLSNTNAIHFDMIRRTYPILRHFHAFCLSHEVKAMKPDPKIYRAAVEMAGCSPEECFYTDDIAAYVEGARQFGIDAVQFQGAEQLQQEMRTRGIL
jgi:putative hydrolase of the HAD superfamily